ncbi:hypothetical protein WT01_36390 [Burkholderia cepacia]|uniref:DUF485 domain-containing protein n=1 Tax=Burkholderia cepacia TaxID=292 RepID=UPI0007568E0D|nr:DUF485 domain-containing protein [Burkholderia cepacia]KVL46554.1 hypothetical protein WT01_36390 [Burkholderia cepacia]
MTNKSPTERIREHPRFRELVTRRSRLSLTLFALVMAAYFGLIALTTFRPDVLRMLVGASTVTNVGIVLAVSVLVLGWAVTWIYVRRANGEFDEISHQILDEAAK